MEVNRNDSLICVVLAIPQPSFVEIVSIGVDGERQLVERMEVTESLVQYELIVEVIPTSLEESGTVYECRSQNSQGNGTDNITLIVQGKV